jgi:hypothetical protein
MDVVRRPGVSSVNTCDESGLLEMAHRDQGPIEVALFLDRRTGGAVLVIWNWDSGVCLQFDVEAGLAGYAFTHPYAFAAAHGIPASVMGQAA